LYGKCCTVGAPGERANQSASAASMTRVMCALLMAMNDTYSVFSPRTSITSVMATKASA